MARKRLRVALIGCGGNMRGAHLPRLREDGQIELAAVADPATAERVELDFEEGQALGVSSTPTFFLDGELLELQEWDDLENAIQAAVNGGR